MLKDNQSQQKHVQIIVDHLISRCRWDSNRLRRAAESAEGFELRFFLTKCSGERTKFVSDLFRFAPAIEDYGEQTEPNVRIRVRPREVNDEMLARECMEREDDLLRVYEDALSETLPEGLRTLIAMQATRILETYDILTTFTRKSTHALNNSHRVFYADRNRSVQ